uniref:Peptidase A2 domain-containing protein n=1 Tax=Bracon brevicornis TaxID=1563983 RepID=A0A6V7LXQ6_9HYME
MIDPRNLQLTSPGPVTTETSQKGPPTPVSIPTFPKTIPETQHRSRSTRVTFQIPVKENPPQPDQKPKKPRKKSLKEKPLEKTPENLTRPSAPAIIDPEPINPALAVPPSRRPDTTIHPLEITPVPKPRKLPQHSPDQNPTSNVGNDKIPDTKSPLESIPIENLALSLNTGEGPDCIPYEDFLTLIYENPTENRQFIPLTLGKRVISALVDTGANRSFILKEACAAFKGFAVPLDEEVTLGNGETTQLDGCIVLNIAAGGTRCMVPFRLTDALAYECVIGIDV